MAASPRVKRITGARWLRRDIDWYAVDLDGDSELDPSLAGRFAAVVATGLIEHLDDPDAILRNALGLSIPGRGHVFLSTLSGQVRETERRVGHRRHHSADEMSDLLVATGREPVRVWNTGYPFHDLSKWYANRNPDATMERFGEREYSWSEDLICTALRFAFRFNSERRGA